MQIEIEVKVALERREKERERDDGNNNSSNNNKGSLQIIIPIIFRRRNRKLGMCGCLELNSIRNVLNTSLYYISVALHACGYILDAADANFTWKWDTEITYVQLQDVVVGCWRGNADANARQVKTTQVPRLCGNWLLLFYFFFEISFHLLFCCCCFLVRR